jgi:adenylate cyclase
MNRMNNLRLRFPIVFKLVFITVVLLLSGTLPIAYRSAQQFEQISIDRESDANRDQARARATEVEGSLISYIDKAKIIAAILQKDYSSEAEKQSALELTFRGDRDLVAVEVVSVVPDKPVNRVVNEEYLKNYGLDKGYVETLRQSQRRNNSFPFTAVFAGQIEIRNASLEGGAPLLSIGIPLMMDDAGRFIYIAIAEVRLDRLQTGFAQISDRLIFLVDRDGQILAHPDEKKVFAGSSLKDLPVVKAAQASTFREGASRYQDSETKEWFRGAFRKTSLNVTVIAVASEAAILEAASRVKRIAFNIAGTALSIAFFFIFLFSITLTAPLEKLVDMTTEVAKGNFSVQANIKSRDEVGQLGAAFDHMIVGLQERDKVKNMFAKFHGSSVTEDLMKGDLALGGSKKTVVVFFSDIRDFTKFSEGHTPEEVVDMLNEYFQIMVGIINKNGGIVDKFIGDAIMAVWGAPSGTPEDPQKAVRACVDMRSALEKLNESRGERGKIPIKIGMGLHFGEAISGTIGSDERMEYTVIGDTVNQAARIEASTKAFGTDLLISDALFEAIKEQFIIEEAGKVEVKGKSQPLTLFKVRGYLDENGQQVLVRTKYSDYEAGHDDKVKVAS